MKPSWFPVTLAALALLVIAPAANSQTCSIGGHDETSENFAPGGWGLGPPSPGVVVGAPTASHLIFTEVAPRGFGTGALSDSSEYIEIYNPTTRTIKFDNKYIADEISYYRVVNGVYPAANNSDWVLKFPLGLALNPGRTLVLCVTKLGFASSGATAAGAQYFLEMKDSNGLPADDMIIMTTISTFPLSGGVLTNPAAANGEWCVLFCWNGVSDNVCDIDYASWGANSATNTKMSKTGISIDGPDAGPAPSPFNPDTAPGAQTNLGSGAVLVKPNTYQRFGGEAGEIALGGNGCIGKVVPALIAWAPVAATSNIRFQVRWSNPDDDSYSTQFSGQMSSQEFGVFLPDYGQIGTFNVPPMAPSSFFDVFFEIPISSLPLPPMKQLPGGGPPAPGGPLTPNGTGSTATTNCPPDTNWAGNVDIFWSGPGQGGQVNRHYGDLLTCRGGPPSYIHFRPSNCANPMPWTLAGVCPGFSVTLVNEDHTPAPNPVPVGWSGWICVSTAAAVPSGTNCCFAVTFGCGTQSATIDICSTACDWQTHPPTLSAIDWVNVGPDVRFRLHWMNPDPGSPSDPASGDLRSQMFGVFQPDAGLIGPFNVPPIPPNSFFDVFIQIPVNQLPPEPATQLPGGGPPPGGPCPPDTVWKGNVDVNWSGPGGTGQVNRHYGRLPICPGAGPSYIHVLTNCTIATGLSWVFNGLCPGFNATLVNEDFSPAPNPLPPGWTGWICVASPPATPLGLTCCFRLDFLCGTEPATIELCASTCDWSQHHSPTLTTVDWSTIGTNSRFHLRWNNSNPSMTTGQVTGDMKSQMFGVFVPDAGPIGSFTVPPLSPNSFFDVFIDVPLNQLPPQPPLRLPGGGPTETGPCPPPTTWRGNVDVNWNGPDGVGQVNRHFSDLPVCPGGGPSYVHLITSCPDPAGLSWAISGICAAFTSTLINEDFSPAPNPLPPGWSGWICAASPAGTPNGTLCCFKVDFLCAGAPGSIEVCARTCDWSVSSAPPVPAGLLFGIYMASPNPSRSGMSIAFVLPEEGTARLDIFNVSGKLVRALLDGHTDAGPHLLAWDGRGEGGQSLPPGVYFMKLQFGGRSATKKAILSQ